MEPDRLLLIFERSPDESQLTGVREAIRALGETDTDVKAPARNPGVGGLIERVLRFWFPYLWSEGITGVGPGAAVGSPAEVSEFNIPLARILDPVSGAVLGTWLQARSGRKVRVKCDDTEIEAQTPKQVEALLARVEALRQRRGAARAKKP
jgi:hypothetical protein